MMIEPKLFEISTFDTVELKPKIAIIYAPVYFRTWSHYLYSWQKMCDVFTMTNV